MNESLLSLRRLRQVWEVDNDLETEETRRLRALTVQEGLQQWLALQRAFEWQLQQTASIFAADRHASLAELQARLQRLAEYQKQHGQPLPLDQALQHG
ncbi:MAG: hypothetical protein KIS63_15095 [Caldilineales bacterium]|nr:hypothetical protein [Caldilineales bacterium]